MEVNLDKAVRSLNNVDRQLRDLAKTPARGNGTAVLDTVEISEERTTSGASGANALLGELQAQLAPLMDLIGDSAGRQKDLKAMFADPRQVDAIRSRAQELLDGYFNVENTASRIFDFAFSFFDGSTDRETFAREMQQNIYKGFDLAERELGGLADISLETRDAIDEKIEAFINPEAEKESGETAA